MLFLGTAAVPCDAPPLCQPGSSNGSSQHVMRLRRLACAIGRFFSSWRDLDCALATSGDCGSLTSIGRTHSYASMVKNGGLPACRCRKTRAMLYWPISNGPARSVREGRMFLRILAPFTPFVVLVGDRRDRSPGARAKRH